MISPFEPRRGARLGDWMLLRPGGAGEWEGSWLVQDGAGALGVAYLLRQNRPDLSRLVATKHPALVELVGMGERPVPFLVRECIGGKPLSAYMMSGAAPEALAVSIAAQVASGLAALHAEGLCHGSLSDARVLVESIREPRVLLVGQGLAGERWHGGLDHAAPESVRGAGTEPPADVYTLGLVLWQLMHGRLPWAEHGRSQALIRRAREQPRAWAGSSGLREIVNACLSLEPSQRPSALEVVRGLEEQGARLCPPDGLHLRRRSRAITVLEPRVRRELDRWLDDGGRLGLLGPSGSGRTRLLDALSTALRVRGMPFARVTPGGRAWDAIEHALCSPGLPGAPVVFPAWASPTTRAQVAAMALAQRSPSGLHLLVDDLELLDAASRRCVEVLSADERVHICASAREATPWMQRTCELAPWKREQVLQLLRGVLGEVEGQQELADQLWSVAGGVPGPTIQRLLALIQAHALRWDVLRWVVVTDRLPRALQDTTVPDDPMAGLSPVARQLGSTLALVATPCTVEYLCHLAAVEEEEGRLCARELVHAGLARVEHRQILPRNAEALEDLRRVCDDPRAVYRRLLALQLELPELSLVRVGWLLLGAEDAAVIQVHGAGAIDAVSQRDAEDGAVLAQGLWRITPHDSLVAPTVRALARAGRHEEALAFGERWLEGHFVAEQTAQVAAAMAWVHAHGSDGDGLAREWIERCRALPGDEPELLSEVEAKLAFAAGELPAAVRAARRLADREAPEGDPDRLDRWLMLRGLWARALQRGGSSELAVGVLEPLPARLGRDRPSRAVLDALLGGLLLELGRHAEAEAAMERALARDLGLPPVARARLLHDLGVCQRRLGKRERALARWREALLLLERAGEAAQGLAVIHELARCLGELCRVEEAEAAWRLALDRASRVGDDAAGARAALGLAALLGQRGEIQEAERWLARATELVQPHSSDELRARLACGRAELALLRRAPEAAARLQEAIERARLCLGQEIAGVLRAQLVLVQTRAGRIEALDERVEETLTPLLEAGVGLASSEARLWLAEALLVAGRRAQGEAMISRARLYADEIGHLRLGAWADELLTRYGARSADEPRADQLGQLLELAMAVVRERDTDRLLVRIAHSALELLDAERAFVLLGMVGTMEVAAAVSRDGLEPGRPSTSVVHRALREGKEVIAADISERRDLRDAVSVLTMDLASAMCVPMVEDEITIGAIYVDSRRTSVVEPARAVQLLRTLAGYAAVAVSNVEQLALVAQRADEAAEIAHDIRSPAASITILAEELLQALPSGHAGRDRAQRILLAAGRIQDMASAMLQAERVHRRPLDLSALVGRAVALEEPAARRAGVALELDLEPGLEVDGDALALTRVVGNLVGNALRHSPKGGAVSIQLAPSDGDACLRVRDRGPGIPEGSEERIFQRGVKLGERAGHGMGLAIARRIVEQHDGRIVARNLGDRGAEVMFAIPLLV